MRAQRDFFVSYAAPDVSWAEWIAWQLERAGYSVTLQAWDFRPGQNFVSDMQTALEGSDRVIAVLSDSYLRSKFASSEWFAAFARDPRGEDRVLLPVKVGDCNPDGLLGQIVWIDLLGADEHTAVERLLGGIRSGRTKPTKAPSYPANIRPSFPPIDVESPYRGLAPFETEHRDLFFGRSRYVAAAKEILANRSVVCIVGASGAGKSSLVRAGVLPALERNGALVTVCRPREDPFVGLARGLVPLLEPDLTDHGPIWLAANRYADEFRRTPSRLSDVLHIIAEQKGQRICLAIDQFEEVFAQAADIHRTDFVTLLEDLRESSCAILDLVLAVRADFMDQVLAFDPLRQMLQDTTLFLGPMNDDELMDAIIEPARARGVRFETGLPERLLRDAAASTDQDAGAASRLPLLQFALSELWLRQRDRVIEHVIYDDAELGIGGIEGALRRHAERVYRRFGEDERGRVRRLFRRLAKHGSGFADVRRSVPRREVAADWDLVAELSHRRLITVSEDRDGSVVEVVHEALFRAWPDLRDWISEHKEFDLWRQELGARARTWDAAPPATRRDLLLRGAVLAVARTRASERPQELSTLETAFVAAGETSERRSRLRMTGAISVAFVAIVFIAIFAGMQWMRAEEQRNVAVDARTEAERQADLAIARQLATTARQVLNEEAANTGFAAKIAVASVNRRVTPEAVQILRSALDLTPEVSGPAPTTLTGPQTAISDDARVQAFFREDFLYAFNDDVTPHATAHLLDSATLEIRAVHRDPGSSRSVFSPDGRFLATGGPSRRLRLLDTATGTVVQETAYRTSVYPAFSPDGDTLYALRSDGEIEVRVSPDWGIADRLMFPVGADRGPPLAGRVTRNGESLVVLDKWRAAHAVPTNGAQGLTLAAWDGKRTIDANNATTIALSPTESLALVQRNRGEAVVYDLATGKVIAEFQDPYFARVAAFSPDGSRAATANHNGVVNLRCVRGCQEQRVWEHGAEVDALAFSPDGRFVVTGGEDGEVAVWDIETGALAQRFKLSGAVLAVAFDPRDSTLLVGDITGALTRHDLARGDVIAKRIFSGRVAALAVSGDAVLATVQDSEAQAHWEDMVFVDRETGAERAFVMRNTDFMAHSLSPDGSQFAAFERLREELKIFDTATGELVQTLPDFRLGTYAFSADGRRILVNLPSGPVRVIDIATGRHIAELGEPGGVDEIGLPPDGRTIVTQGGKSFRGWDLATGAPLWSTQTRADYPGVSDDGRRFFERLSDEADIVVRETDTGANIASLPTKGWIRKISTDGRRVLTAERIIDPESNKIVGNIVEIWDVDRMQAIYSARYSDPLILHNLPGDRSGVFELPTEETDQQARMTMIDLTEGRRLWSETVPLFGFSSLLTIRGAPEIAFMMTPDSVALRKIDTGEAFWDFPPSGLLAAAAVGDDAIAIATHGQTKNIVALISRATGDEIRRFGEDDYARDLWATPDGRYLVAAIQSDQFYGLRIWDVESGARVHEIALDASPEKLVSLGDTLIAVKDFLGSLRAFDVETGEMVRRISHERRAFGTAHAARADRTITWSGASLRLWDTRTGRELNAQIADGDILHAALSPDGRVIAYQADRPEKLESGRQFEAVVIWTPGTDPGKQILPVDGLSRLQFDRTGTRLLLTGRNGAWLRVVDAETLRTMAVLRPLPGGRFDQIALSGDGRALLVEEMLLYKSGLDNVWRRALRAFDLDSTREIARIGFGGQEFHPVAGGSDVLLYGLDQRWRTVDVRKARADSLIVADADPKSFKARSGTPVILGWRFGRAASANNTATGESVALADAPTADTFDGVVDADLSHDGRHAILTLRKADASEDAPSMIAVYDTKTGGELARHLFDREMYQVDFIAGGKAAIISEHKFSAIPNRAEQQLLRWTWRTDEVATLMDDNPVTGLAVGPGGDRFATIEGYVDEDDNTPVGIRRLALWNADGTRLAETPLDFNAFRIAYAPDGAHIAVSGWGFVRIFSVPDLAIVREFRHSTDRQTSRDYSVDPAPLMSGAPSLGFVNEGRGLIFTVAAGALVYDIASDKSALLHESEPVSRMDISMDGALIALEGKTALSVWDAATLTPISRAKRDKGSDLTFGGVSGTELFALGNDQLSRVEWTPEALTSRVCAQFVHVPWAEDALRVLGEPILDPCGDPVAAALVRD